MTPELQIYLTQNAELIKSENYEYLQLACSGELRKELCKLLLECSNNDYSIIYRQGLELALQQGINEHVSNVHICFVSMSQPNVEGDVYKGYFEYILVTNGEMVEGKFNYEVISPQFPRGSNILKTISGEFVETELGAII